MAKKKPEPKDAPMVQDQLSGEQDPKQKPTQEKGELQDQPNEPMNTNPVDKQSDKTMPNMKSPGAGGPQLIPAKAAKGPSMMEDIYTGTAENLYTESAYHPDSMLRPYNPDKLVRKDWAYRIYEDMLEDDQVFIALEVKKDLILGSGFYFETKDDGQEEIQEDLEIAFEEKGDRPFADTLKDMMQAYEYGFSISEKIFGVDSLGKLFLKDCKPRHPSTWLLHTDPQGNVTRYEQRALHNSIDADPKSIIHYVNNPKHQNPYGRSDLYVAFQAWMTKRHITRFYAIFLEKAASPTPVAKYDRRADQKAIDDIYNAIKQFQTKTALTIPKEFEIDFLEAKSSGEAYVKGITLFNMLIGRSMFMPDLLGFQGKETGGGSYGLGEHQIDVFLRHVQRRRELLERVVNMHFVKPICMYNYGMLENFPKFKFNPLSEDDAMTQASTWVTALSAKAWTVTPEEVNHFRGLIKFPQSSVVDILGTLPIGPDGQNLDPLSPDQAPKLDKDGNPIPPKPGDPNGQPGQDGGAPKPGEEKTQTNIDGDKGPQDAVQPDKGPPVGDKAGKGQALQQKGAPGDNAAQKGKGQDAPPNKGDASPGKIDNQGTDQNQIAAKKKDKKFSLDLSSIKGNYYKKVNFEHLDTVMTSTVSKILTESKPIVDDIFEDLYDQLQKKKIIPSQNLEKANSIELKYLKRLQLVFKRNFRRLWQDGRESGKTEVNVKDHDVNNADNIPSDEFLDFLDQETFRYIGDWEYTITKKVKDELVKAIKDGRPLSEVINVLDNEGMDLSDVSLERFARTKTTEVFNKGRKAYFSDTGIVSGYQYSAVMDDRTSDICEGLDNCKFDAGDEPTPPMHFNCRSVLIPITKFEEYEPDDEANNGDDIDKFIDDNIGKGFPVG